MSEQKECTSESDIYSLLEAGDIEGLRAKLPALLEELAKFRRYASFAPGNPFDNIDFGCSGCENAEWRDEEYDWNIAEGYWYCTKYYEGLSSTWNDYGCIPCEECNKDRNIDIVE